MRLPVGVSLLVHVAVLLAALRLPAVRDGRASKPIEVVVNHVPPSAPATPAPVKPAAPEPRAPAPRVAMRSESPRDRERERRERESATPPQPVEPPVTPQPPEPPSSLSPRAAQVDLRLHALPGAGGDLALPAGSGGGYGPGSVSGTVATVRKPWKPRGDAGDPITGKIPEVKEEEFPLTSLGRDGFVYKGPQFSAHIALDGSVSFDDKTVRDFKGLSGSFDLTDIAMRGRKEDPYRHQKKKFLETTGAMREKLARQARAQEMASSLATLPSHLETIWEDSRLRAPERRELLYKVWKETVSSDDGREQAASEARHIIERFIRARLPEGSTDAYTEDELIAFSRGKLPFAPYK